MIAYLIESENINNNTITYNLTVEATSISVNFR